MYLNMQKFHKLKRAVCQKVAYTGEQSAMEHLTGSGDMVLGEVKQFITDAFALFGNTGEPTEEFVKFAIGKLVESMKHIRTRFLNEHPGEHKKGGLEKGHSGRGITWEKLKGTDTTGL